MRILLFLCLAGCMPKGPQPLQPLTPGPQAEGTLITTASAQLEAVPSRGLELITQLQLTNQGEGKVRVDLTRARVRVDGGRFVKCNQGPDTDLKLLITHIEPGASAQTQLRCTHLEKPVRTIELQFHASGIGKMGEITVGFVGLGERQ